MRKLLIILLSNVLAMNLIYSQDSIQIIELDTITGIPKTEPPFDKEFYLRIYKDKEAKISSLEIRKINKYGNVKNFINREIKIIHHTYDTLNAENDKYTFNTSLTDPTKTNQLILYLNNLSTNEFWEEDKYVLIKIFPLNPREYYSFRSTSYEINSEKLNTELAKIINIPNITKKKTDNAVKNLNTLKYEVESLIKSENYKDAIGILILYDSLYGPKKLYEKITALNEKKERSLSGKVDFSDFLNCYDIIIPKLLDCKAYSKDKYILEKFDFNLSNDLINSWVRDSIDLVGNGVISISDFNKVFSVKFKKRIENLKGTITYIDKILTLYQHYEGKKFKCNTIVQLHERLNTLKELQKQYKDLLSLICDYKRDKSFMMAKYESSNSLINTPGYTTLKTKGKFAVRPDFGVGVVSNLITSGSENSYTSIMPFMGIRLNFRPVDPDIPYSGIKYKTFAHRSSINISFSLTSISNGQTRFDLYKNKSFLLGYGFRVNNVLNLTTGAIFFNKLNTDPFISNKEFTALPYVGASIDFEILQAFKNLKDVFK